MTIADHNRAVSLCADTLAELRTLTLKTGNIA